MNGLNLLLEELKETQRVQGNIDLDVLALIKLIKRAIAKNEFNINLSNKVNIK
jgi:hypothetical protein